MREGIFKRVRRVCLPFLFSTKLLASDSTRSARLGDWCNMQMLVQHFLQLSAGYMLSFLQALARAAVVSGFDLCKQLVV